MFLNRWLHTSKNSAYMLKSLRKVNKAKKEARKMAKCYLSVERTSRSHKDQGE